MHSRHCSADGLTYRNAGWIKPVQVEDIDAEVGRRDAFAMEGMDATGLAEVVASSLRSLTSTGQSSVEKILQTTSELL